MLRTLVSLALLMAAGRPALPVSVTVGSESQRDAVTTALYELVDRDRGVQRRATLYLRERGERDAIPFMVVAMRYEPFRSEVLIETLGSLSGEEFGESYAPWAEWVIREDIEPHPAFRQWKADLLARLYPRFGVFLDAERPSTIDYRGIQWGGVFPESLPALDSPPVIEAAAADYLADDELIFGVALAPSPDAAGAEDSTAVEARAYPLRVLDWHELTNDDVAGIPLALSYCTLCGSAVLFDRRAGQQTYSFASSGLLYRSNKLMFDHETETLWSNLTGEPVLGPLVGRGIELQMLPLVVTTWSDWRSRYPDTTVVSLETGYERDYRPGQAYGEYFASPDTMFPVGVRDDRLATKAWVYGIRSGDSAVAFELEAVQRAGVVNAEVGDQSVVLVAGAGRAVRAYDRGDRSFEGGTDVATATTLVATDGTRWRLTDVALYEEGGAGFLRRLPGHLAYWFGWYAFFPETGLWTGR